MSNTEKQPILNFKATNNTAGPRLIFHAGEGNVQGGTHVPRGGSAVVKMTDDEAANAKCPGFEIVELSEAEAVAAAGGLRVFFAVADDASGTGMAPLEIPADKFVGIAVGAERPTDAAGYKFQAVTQAAPDVVLKPAAETVVEAIAERAKPAGGEATTAGGAGEATEPGPDGTSTITGGAGNDAIEPATAIHRGAGKYSIMRGDTELVGQLSKDDAVAFNALDDVGKAAFIAERAKPAE